MFTTNVTDPVGAEWSVKLQIIPDRQGIGFYERFIGRWLKKKKKTSAKDEGAYNVHWLNGITFPDSVDDFRLLLLFIFAVILFYFIGWPLLLFLLDFIWFVIVLLGAVVSILVFKHPVTVVAQSEDHTFSWKVRGLVAARKKQLSVVQDISAGIWLKEDQSVQINKKMKQVNFTGSAVALAAVIISLTALVVAMVNHAAKDPYCESVDPTGCEANVTIHNDTTYTYTVKQCMDNGVPCNKYPNR